MGVPGQTAHAQSDTAILAQCLRKLRFPGKSLTSEKRNTGWSKQQVHILCEESDVFSKDSLKGLW